MKNVFKTTAVVRRFPQKGGWHYVPVDQGISELVVRKPRWGMIPVTITIGNTTWKKALLPMGDGSLFIALNKKVREAEDIKEGDRVTATYRIG